MKGNVRLVYRKIIDASSARRWEQGIYHDTYREMIIQAQEFDPEGKYQTVAEMKRGLPRVDQMIYLVSTAAMGYLQSLDGQVPDLVDDFGQPFLTFENFKFDLISSDIKDKSKHQVAILFYTDWLIWLDTIQDKLLLSSVHTLAALERGEPIETYLIGLNNQLQIAFYQAK